MKGLRDKGINNPAALIDGDPKTDALMATLREAWDNAPAEPGLNGARIKLPGYLVPLAAGWMPAWWSVTSPRNAEWVAVAPITATGAPVQP